MASTAVNRRVAQVTARLPARVIFRAMVAFGLVSLSYAIPASADQWTPSLTLTAAHAEDDGNTLVIYVTTAQAVANPANCSATDGYIVIDPVITNQTLAEALAALSSGAPVQIYVSSTQCARNRPVILEMQVDSLGG